jgi:hypothetical protein
MANHKLIIKIKGIIDVDQQLGFSHRSIRPSRTNTKLSCAIFYIVANKMKRFHTLNELDIGDRHRNSRTLD